jgi:hypothetical protein
VKLGDEIPVLVVARALKHTGQPFQMLDESSIIPLLMKLLAAETLSRLVKFSGDCGHDAANIQALGRLLKHQTSLPWTAPV